MVDRHPNQVGPITPEYYEQMNAIAGALKDIFQPAAFALLIFPPDIKQGDGVVNYISNVERESMLVAMKEFIARAEGTYFEPPRGKIS